MNLHRLFRCSACQNTNVSIHGVCYPVSPMRIHVIVVLECSCYFVAQYFPQITFIPSFSRANIETFYCLEFLLAHSPSFKTLFSALILNGPPFLKCVVPSPELWILLQLCCYYISPNPPRMSCEMRPSLHFESPAHFCIPYLLPCRSRIIIY